MIIYMYNVMCVTNRNLCQGDFLKKIEEILDTRPYAILLREKDLSEKEYKALASKVMEQCKAKEVPLILHSHVAVAKELGLSSIHLPLPMLRSLSKEVRSSFQILGSSCHSLKEAKEAQELGCTYMIAGHIFATDCKKGLPPRGLGFLKEICEEVSIPVWAIGGITMERMDEICKAGAKGGCMMSGFMMENVQDEKRSIQ